MSRKDKKDRNRNRSSRKKLGLLALSGNVAAFGLTFSLVLFCANKLTPLPPDYGLRDKFEVFVEKEEEYDALFFGSSRIARSVVPEMFDETLEKEGIRWKTYNLGIPAMEAFEADYLIRKVLERKPGRLKWVLIEANKWDLGTPEFGKYTERSVFWHSIPETRNLLKYLSTFDVEWHKRWQIAANHLLQCAWNLSGYGKGPSIVAALLLPADEPNRKREIYSRSQGYMSLEQEEGREFERRRKAFIEDSSELVELTGIANKYVVKFRKDPRSVVRYNLAALREQQELFREAGVRAIYIAPPTIKGALPPPWILYEKGILPNLLTYTLPRDYPFLYEAEWHFDVDHLSREGAERYSEVLAGDVAGLIKRSGAGR